MAGEWIILVVVSLIVLTGFITFLIVHHYERRQWLNQAVDVDPKYAEAVGGIAPSQLTVFDVLYDVVWAEPLLAAAISRLRIDQSFDNIEQLVDFLAKEASVSVVVKTLNRRAASNYRPQTIALPLNNERHGGFYDEDNSAIASLSAALSVGETVIAAPYISVACTAIRAGLEAGAQSRDRLIEQTLIGVARSLSPSAARFVGRFIQAHVAIPGPGPLAEKACQGIFEWLCAKWNERHLHRAMKELENAANRLMDAYVSSHKQVVARATLRHSMQLRKLRSARDTSEGIVLRTMFPSLGSKCLSMAISRTAKELAQIEANYESLRAACQDSKHKANILGALRLYREGESIFVGFEEIIESRRAMETPLRTAEQERSRLKLTPLMAS